MSQERHAICEIKLAAKLSHCESLRSIPGYQEMQRQISDCDVGKTAYREVDALGLV
jgi:hypothetical protein